MYVCMCTPTSSEAVTLRAAITLLSSTSESRAADTPLSTTSRATGTPLSTNSRAAAKTPLSTTSKAVATPLSTASRAVATPLSTTRKASPVQTLTAACRLAPTVSTSHDTQLGSTKRPKRRHFEGPLHQNSRDWSQQNIFFLNNYIDFTKCLFLNF